MKRFVVLSVLLLASAIHAQVINALGGRTANPPLYFSGTNCRAWGFVQLSGEQDPATGGSTWVQEVRLYIGGTLVKSHEGDGPDSDGTASEWAVFDSTHFPNGALEIKFECTCSAGHVHTSSRSVDVKNYANVYAQHRRTFLNPPDALGFDQTMIAPQVKNQLVSANYSVNMQNGQGWGTTSLNDSLAGANALFVFAHGLASHHETGVDPTQNIDEDDCYPVNTVSEGSEIEGYLNVRQYQVGTALLPPFNPTANPPINLFFLYSCHTGLAPFQTALFPFGNAHAGGQLENQAWISFRTYVMIAGGFGVTSTLMSKLLATWTAWEAVEAIVEEGQEFVKDDPPGSPYRAPAPSDIAFAGDPFTRLRGAYKPELGASTSWYL